MKALNIEFGILLRFFKITQEIVTKKSIPDVNEDFYFNHKKN